MMRNAILITLFTCLLAIATGCRQSSDPVETVSFQSGHFNVVGELRMPKGEGPFPLVIMVHGDGPAYRSYFLKVKECILNAGYATFMWDKPGFGESTGEFTNEQLRAERADILLDAIAFMAKRTDIDRERIGLWGISQAGYVIPTALTKTTDVSFLVLVGCGGENGIRQTAYLIHRQLMFEGQSVAEAKAAEDHFIGLYHAESFDEYISHARPLYDNPVQRQLGFVSALWDETNWKPHDPGEEAFFNPMDIMETVTIPTLVFFGEKDTQVNPTQGRDAWLAAMEKAGNENYRVEIIPGADHNIILCETGSMRERATRTREGWRNYSPQYLEIMDNWLKELNPE